MTWRLPRIDTAWTRSEIPLRWQTTRGHKAPFDADTTPMVAGRAEWSKHFRGSVLVPCLGLLLATLVATWPVVSTLGTLHAGCYSDLAVALWDMEWVERVLFEGRSLLYSTDIFYPKGASLSYHSISWLSGLWALPLRLSLGSTAGYNLFFLSQTLACALTMFVFVRQVSGRSSAAWLAAIVFAFAPFRMHEALSHPNLAGTTFVPLALWGFWQGAREPHPRWSWLAGVSLALTLLTGVHLFIMASITLGSYWLTDALSAGRWRNPRFWRGSALTLGTTLLCCSVPLAQFLLALDSLDAAFEINSGEGRSLDPLGLWMPQPNHPMLGGLGRLFQELWGTPVAYTVYLGWVPALLALVGLFVPHALRRDLWPLALTCALLLVLALGAELTVARQGRGVDLPWLAVADWAPVRALRHPDRFMLLVGACFAPLVGVGFVCLTQRLAGGVTPGLALALGVVILLEYRSGPYPRSYQGPAPAYAQLPADRLALLELPLTREGGKQSMLQQSYHGRPIVGGMVARGMAQASSYNDTSPLLRRLASPRLPPYRCGAFDLAAAWQRLEDDGVGYAVVERRYWRLQRPRLAGYLPARPFATTRDRLLFRVRDLRLAAAEGAVPPCR